MWRYLALASAIVVGLCLAVLAIPSAPRQDGASRYATGARATAGPAQNDAARAATALPMTGDAPWALSALPECFEQRTSRRGSIAYARAFLVGAHPIRPGTVVRVADCIVVFSGDAATVARGEDRLRIPSPARFYTRGGATIVERREQAHDDVRVYVPQTSPR